MNLFSFLKRRQPKTVAGRARKAQLNLEVLERREVPAGISFNNVTGVLTIDGSSHDDVAKVAIMNNKVHVKLTSGWFFGDAKTYAPASVKSIVFDGFEGNDNFTNNTSIKCEAYGGSGNDILSGGSGDDLLYGLGDNDQLYGNGGNDNLQGSSGNDHLNGGSGDDVLYGGSGKDWLLGVGGTDRLYGNSGNDYLYGGNDNDALYGGRGDDELYGEAGDDVLVSIGGDHDVLTGGTGRDSFWMDTSDVLTDASGVEHQFGYVHGVYEFFRYSYDGGLKSIPVSKELDGQDLADPLADSSQMGLTIKNFGANPLFASLGPTMDDIFQGNVGDCYFLAALAGIPKSRPDFIRNMVVDLGDGTYAVRFYSKGQAQFVRVDADLWVQGSTPQYAGLGQGNSLWVAIVEKAYAFFRMQAGSYTSIGTGGNGTTDKHLNATWDLKSFKDGVTAQQVIDWVNNDRPKGALRTTINEEVVGLLNWIKSKLDAGMPVTVGSVSSLSDSMKLKLGDWHSAQHVYTGVKVFTDARGKPTLVLRNPYGAEVTLKDFATIYFYCYGDVGALKL